MADTSTRDTEKSTAKTAEHIEKQRNLMEDVARLASAASIDFDKHTKSFGSSVKDLTRIEKLQAKIKNIASESESIELNILDLFKKKAVIEGEVDVTRLASLQVKEREAELVLKSRKDDVSRGLAAALFLDAQRELKEESERIINKRKELTKSIDLEVKKSMELLENDRKRLKVLNAIELVEKQIQKIPGVTLSFYRRIFELFKQIDTEMFSLRKHFGLFRDDSQKLELLAKSLNEEFAGMGVTIGISSAAIKAVGDNFGRISTASDETFKSVALLSAQLGISEKTSSDVLRNFAGISGKLLKDVSEGMLGFTKELSAAAGTNLNEVMADIAGASDTVRATFRGNTLELIKTTVEARRMGLSLESMAKTADGLLDFNSSVNAEMEASVLLGKNLNLNEARRRAWVGDILGANKEILKVVKSAGDFDKMNVMQRKALAAAVGKSVEELQKMVTIDKEIAHVEARGTPEQRAQLALYKDRLKLSEKEKIDLGKNFQERMKIEANQERMAALTQRFNEMLLTLGKDVMDKVIEPFLKLAIDILPGIIQNMRENSGAWKFVLGTVSAIAAVVGTIGTVMATVGTVTAAFSLIMGKASAVAAIAAAKVAMIGAAVIALKAVIIGVVAFLGYKLGNLIFEWTEEAGTFWGEMSVKAGKAMDGVIDGIRSAGSTILRWMKSPFESFFNWFYDSSGIPGKSPSKIGLSIVDGIISIGSSLITALTTPFTSAFTFITELFGRIPEFITKVFKRGFDFVTKLPGMGLLTKAIDTFSGNKTADVNQKVETVQTKQDDTNRLILEKLTELTNLMKSGGIAINMDGRRVSEALAHASSR